MMTSLTAFTPINRILFIGNRISGPINRILFPGTLVHMMGLPRSMTIKTIKKHDFPKPGMLTFASMGYRERGGECECECEFLW